MEFVPKRIGEWGVGGLGSYGELTIKAFISLCSVIVSFLQPNNNRRKQNGIVNLFKLLISMKLKGVAF